MIPFGKAKDTNNQDKGNLSNKNSKTIVLHGQTISSPPNTQSGSSIKSFFNVQKTISKPYETTQNHSQTPTKVIEKNSFRGIAQKP